MANVQQLLEQQESFQLWCQHPLASLTHCLQLLDDLEYNPAARPVANIPKTHYAFSNTEGFLWIN